METAQAIDDCEGELQQLDHRFSQLPLTGHEAIFLAVTVEEGIQSSSIEGEEINREDVRSSLLNNIQLGGEKRSVRDIRAAGVARLQQESLRDVRAPLSLVMIRYWHELLFRDLPYAGVRGDFRDSGQPMRIVSGPPHRLTIHFEAPPSERVPNMMQRFVNPTKPAASAILRAALDHVHFESIHPFSDGNGRVGRAIMERTILQTLNGRPLLSISQAIRATRSDYYAALQEAQRSLDVTGWLRYYFATLQQAIANAGELIGFTLRKADYYRRLDAALSPKQAKVIQRMWAAGPAGFEGGMTAKKYGRIAGVAPATASRQLAGLVGLGALVRVGAGRGTRYRLPEG